MGVRVIYRTDVFSHGITGPENFAALVNNPVTSPTPQNLPPSSSATTSTITPSSSSLGTHSTINENQSDNETSHLADTVTTGGGHSMETRTFTKVKKSDRGDSFPKLRLSPKTFRFSSRFGRSKSEVEKCPSDPFHNYSKSFQEVHFCLLTFA